MVLEPCLGDLRVQTPPSYGEYADNFFGCHRVVGVAPGGQKGYFVLWHAKAHVMYEVEVEIPVLGMYVSALAKVKHTLRGGVACQA